MATKADDDKLLYCSFCGKSQHEVKKLIAGPSVFICNECVDLCNDIIKEEMLLLSENGLEPKDIGKYVSETSRQYFFQRLNEVTGIE